MKDALETEGRNLSSKKIRRWNTKEHHCQRSSEAEPSKAPSLFHHSTQKTETDFNGRKGMFRFLVLAATKVEMPINLFLVKLALESVLV